MLRHTERLADHTWLRIGGDAEIAVPECRDELVDLLTECSRADRAYRILGNGSNLLVPDDGVDELVIKHTEACTEVEVDDGLVRAGASVAVPQFVNTLVQADLGGYEYLYSVPGTLGGALFMNAGRGECHDATISDHLVEVEVFDGESVRTVPREELTFSHRYSTFHEQPTWTILSATFDPPDQPQSEGREKISERMEKVDRRERGKPNAGSVFKSGVRLPLDRLPPGGLRVGDARFVASNRICHDGDTTYDEVRRLLRRAQLFHRIVPGFETPRIEWEVWE